MYCALAARWAKPPEGPNWIESTKTGAVGLRPANGIGDNYTLLVATRAPLLLRFLSKAYIAHAGLNGIGKNGRWRHVRNVFGVPRFIMLAHLSVARISVSVFERRELACQQYINSVHCSHVAVYDLNVANAAFAAVGIIEDVGFFVLGHGVSFPSLRLAHEHIAQTVPVRNTFVLYDRKGCVLDNSAVPQTIEKRQCTRTRPACKEWCAVWRPEKAKWLKKDELVFVNGVSVTVKRAVVRIKICLLCRGNPGNKSPTVYLKEAQSYNFLEPWLCGNGNDPKLSSSMSLETDKTAKMHSAEVSFCISYERATRLHSSATFPYAMCTLVFDDFGQSKKRLAVGGLCIGRYAHTDILHGVHLRAVPLSSHFYLVETHRLTLPTEELARVLRRHTWLEAAEEDVLLSVVRAEQMPDVGKPIAKLCPGELSVMLQTLGELRAEVPVMFKTCRVTTMYPQVPRIMPLTRREIEKLESRPSLATLRSFLCVTLPDDLKL